MPPFPSTNIAVLPSVSFPYISDRYIVPMPPVNVGKVETMDQAMALLQEARDRLSEQAERIRQLENLAVTDELTGLMNRRGLMATLRRELAESRRNKKRTGLLILIDLDGFKQVNDVHGHSVGDAYLQSVASVLLNEVRSTDFVCRLGGDEFAVVLTQIAPKEAAQRLDRLEKAFNARVMHSHNLSLPLRGSFGFALLCETETPDTLIISADAKLYASKAQRKKKLASGIV